MHEHDKIYIDGAWVPSQGTGTIDVFDSTNGEVIGHIPDGNAADVDAAVKAAAAAFPEWAAKTSAEERAKYCTRIAEGLGARMDEIATVVTREAGMPKWLSLMVQAGLPINSFNTAAAIAESYEYETTVGNSLVVREPVGVVGCITPWNYPLHQIAAKVAYAMAAGCTVVLKPSEVAPLDAFILAEVIDDVGLPAGVFNLVTGTGAEVGEAISSHPQVDMVSFTGSTRAGKAVVGRRLGQPQARGPRARRQVRQHPPRRPRRRRLRGRRPRRRGQGLPELGPDLHRPHPHARAPPTGWPTPSASRPTRSRRSSSRRTPSPTSPCSARSPARPRSTGSTATSRRASTRAPSSSSVAPASPRASTRTATS